MLKVVLNFQGLILPGRCELQRRPGASSWQWKIILGNILQHLAALDIPGGGGSWCLPDISNRIYQFPVGSWWWCCWFNYLSGASRSHHPLEGIMGLVYPLFRWHPVQKRLLLKWMYSSINDSATDAPAWNRPETRCRFQQISVPFENALTIWRFHVP